MGFTRSDYNQIVYFYVHFDVKFLTNRLVSKNNQKGNIFEAYTISTLLGWTKGTVSKTHKIILYLSLSVFSFTLTIKQILI